MRMFSCNRGRGFDHLAEFVPIDEEEVTGFVDNWSRGGLPMREYGRGRWLRAHPTP
jgi:hypothetical protein